MHDKNYINHVVFVLDASGSMNGLRSKVIDVADQQIKTLSEQSRAFDQETRATIYQFSEPTECLFYDKDVLRTPSIKGRYYAGHRMGGQTALIDATMQAIADLEKTATLYGDHAFLVYVLTDGAENASRKYRGDQLAARIESLPKTWTFAALVPNQQGVNAALRFGFPEGNIQIWETSVRGLDEVADTFAVSTQSYFTARSQGQTQTYGLFKPQVENLTTINMAELTELRPNDYVVIKLLSGDHGKDIRGFVAAHTGRAYRAGSAYYQLTKPETVQAGKDILVRDRLTQKVYVGSAARTLLGLPNYEIKVAPASYSHYDIFVQSTSVNRKLVGGTDLIVRL